MSQYSVCPDPSMFSDSDGWEYSEPEPDEPAAPPAQWDEAAEGDMRYDIAEEQRLFPAPNSPSRTCVSSGSRWSNWPRPSVRARWWRWLDHPHPRRGMQVRNRR